MRSDNEEKELEKAPKLKVVTVKVLKTTYLAAKVQHPVIGRDKNGKDIPNILKVELTPRVQAALDQKLLEIVEK